MGRSLPAHDADPRFGRFGLRTDCARCGTQVPINGLVHQVDCGDCGEVTTVPNTLFLDLLKQFEEEFPKLTEAGLVIRGDTTWRWTAKAVHAPPCASCGAALDGEAEPDSTACPECGVVQEVQDVPASTRKRVPAAVRVFGDAKGRRADVHTEPVALSCPQCGGGLTLGADRARITPCDFCSTQVHIPDAVWRQLHPPRQVREWVVRFEGETQAAKLAKKRALRAEQKAEQKRKKAEEQAAREAKKAAAEQQRRAEQSARDKARHEQTVRRDRMGRMGTAVAFALTVPAAAFAAVALAVHNTPWVYRTLGMSKGTALVVGPSLLGLAAVGLLIAWLFANVNAARHAGFPVLSTLFFSLFQLLMAVLPGMGLFAGLFLGLFCVAGRFPTPAGEEHKNHKHSAGVSLPLAVLYPVIGVFSSLAAASLLNMTVWELILLFGED